MLALRREPPGPMSRRQTAGRGAEDSSGSREGHLDFRFEGMELEGEASRVDVRIFWVFVLLLGLLGPGSLQRDVDRELSDIVEGVAVVGRRRGE